MMMLRAVCVSLLVALGIASAAHAAPPKELASLTFLIGQWSGGGGGTPGQGDGGTTFAYSLQDRVITRTNFAVIAATDKAPASRHDDLMVIYVDEGGAVKADFYDNEGHVIRYVVTSAASGQVAFTSEPSPSAPRYRITYTAGAAGVVKGTFSIAPPGKPEGFAQYLAWEMRKVRGR
jgi:hypothetical protein